MIHRTLARLAHMDRAELTWRVAAGSRIAVERAAAILRHPRWDRRQLQRVLSDSPAMDEIRQALGRRHWIDAHRRISKHFMTRPRRFPLDRSRKHTFVARIQAEFPDSVVEATSRADRILAGEYDLLGYRGLRFDSDPHSRTDAGSPPDLRGRLPDWHVDPVHQRRAPRRFWAAIDYLDSQVGDHKIIWELNRHQHWLALGRAYWLSSDARYRDRFRAEVASWLAANPPLTGINWASMLELGLRSVSWLWALHFFIEDPDVAVSGQRPDEEPWTIELLLALDRQLTHVERNLSRYFSPNTHLLGEALGLYVAGRALPELAASTRWEAVGRHVLAAEMDRQIGRDGGHCERSAHYHRYALDFYILALIVARLTRDHVAPEFEQAVARLASAARLLADDCGRLPHVGDDDGGTLFPIAGRPADDIRDTLAIAAALTTRSELAIGAAPEEALWMLGCDVRLPHSASDSESSPTSQFHIPSGALPDMGYCVSRSRRGDHLVMDGGAHGYQNGGHAHADALSLTLVVQGQALLVDPGTGSYTTDRITRDRLRSSALHNTLTVDDRSQSLPSGPFHWSHVANAHIHRWRTNDHFDYFDASHNGYRPLEHRRRVLALHGDLLIVSDFVDASGAHTAAVHWHVDPEWHVEVQNHRVTLTAERTRTLHAAHAQSSRSVLPIRVALVVPGGTIETFRGDDMTGLGFSSPIYGQLRELTTVRVTQRATAPFWMSSVFDLGDNNPIRGVEWLPVWSAAGVLAHAAMLRIDRAESIDYVMLAEPVTAPCTFHGTGTSTNVSEIWRAGEIETDARMLFYRVDRAGSIACFAVVDGSIVRGTGGRVYLALPQRISDLHSDLGRPEHEEVTSRN